MPKEAPGKGKRNMNIILPVLGGAKGKTKLKKTKKSSVLTQVFTFAEYNDNTCSNN